MRDARWIDAARARLLTIIEEAGNVEPVAPFIKDAFSEVRPHLKLALPNPEDKNHFSGTLSWQHDEFKIGISTPHPPWSVSTLWIDAFAPVVDRPLSLTEFDTLCSRGQPWAHPKFDLQYAEDGATPRSVIVADAYAVLPLDGTTGPLLIDALICVRAVVDYLRELSGRESEEGT